MASLQHHAQGQQERFHPRIHALGLSKKASMENVLLQYFQKRRFQFSTLFCPQFSQAQIRCSSALATSQTNGLLISEYPSAIQPESCRQHKTPAYYDDIAAICTRVLSISGQA